jgi:dolichol kinase
MILSKRQDMHLSRKFFHVFFGVSFLCLYFFSNLLVKELRWVCLSIAIGAFVFDFFRLRSKKINEKVVKSFSSIMRKSENNSYLGIPFYALGISLSLFFYQEDIAILSILFLVFADPFASFIGILFGKDEILPNKTFEGTVAAFVMSAIIAFLYSFVVETQMINLLIFSIFSGIIVSLAELLSSFNVDDNLTIPVLSGVGMSLLNYFIGIF